MTGRVISPNGITFDFGTNRLPNEMPEFRGLSSSAQRELDDSGTIIMGEPTGFRIRSFVPPEGAVHLSPDGITPQGAEYEGWGFQIESNPPAVVLTDGTRIVPISNRSGLER